VNDYAVILAARMTSERLPGKALAQYVPGGKVTNLAQIVARWRRSRRGPTLVAFTPAGAANEPIAAACAALSVPCYRGNSDVVGSLDGALRAYAPGAAYVARALADNPLVDVGLADARLDVLAETGADGVWYGGDEGRITYAGTTDVWARAAWDRIAAESLGEEREHPGLFFWHNMSKFGVVQLPLPMREYLLPVRTELDEPRDLAMLKALWREAARRGALEPCGELSTLAALDVLAACPDIAALNAEVPLKTQSEPSWRKGLHFGCKTCNHRIGAIMAGDLEVRCPRCGRPQKFYASKPDNPYRRSRHAAFE
jgi:spore coat polysaccharide biosynthesis protein SpsF (cytidylyltransferase family)